MSSSSSSATLALRATKPSFSAHSSYRQYHHCDDRDRHHQELLPRNPCVAPRFLLDGYLLRHSAHLLVLSTRLRPPPPPHPHPHCCRRRVVARRCCGYSGGGGGSGGRRLPAIGGAPVPLRRSVSGRLDLGANCGRRDAPRLVGRDCHRRQGAESDYYDEDEYSGQHRERRNLNERHSRSGDSDRRRWEQRDHYHDDDTGFRRQNDRSEGRGRREYEFDDAVARRGVRAGRYGEDDRHYDHRRERRNFEYEDAVDVRREGAGRYRENNQRSDWRKERRDFEVNDEVDASREERHRSIDDQRYVAQHQWRSDDREDDGVLLLGSRRCHDEDYAYDDLDVAERRYYSRGRSQKSARAYALHEYDSKRASSSRNTIDTRFVRTEENTASSVRWHDNVDRRAEQTYEERGQGYSSSIGWSNDNKHDFSHDDAQLTRVRDSRTGMRDVKVITEDDTNLCSSSKNSSILNHHSTVDHQSTARKDDPRNRAQKIMELSEVRVTNTEHDSIMQSYHLEDRGKYTENRSSSLQSSVKMANDSRRQLDQHDEVDQQVIGLTDSRRGSEMLTDIRIDSCHDDSRTSLTQRNYDEVNQMDIDDRSTSVHNIIHITRDNKRYVNEQVIHETDIDVQNITNIDVSKVHASDISVSRNSQNHLETMSVASLPLSASLVDGANNQQEQIHASSTPMVMDLQSHPEAGLYGQAGSSRISDDTDIPRLEMERTEDGSSVVTADEEKRPMIMGSSEQEVRSETTAGRDIPSGSNARQSVNESLLESAAQLQKSSTFHVGQFVGKVHKGVSDADTTLTRQKDKSIMEGTTRSSSKSRMRGPSDEMWGVQSATSQETFKTVDKEESSSVDGATTLASQTPNNETAIARKVHSQEHDNEGIQKKNGSSKPKDQYLMKSHTGESKSRVASSLKEESLPTGSQVMQTSEAGNVPQVGRFKEDFVSRSSKDDAHMTQDRANQSGVAASPKQYVIGNFSEDSTPTLVDVMVEHLAEHEAATSSMIITRGSADNNTGKGVIASTSSMSINTQRVGQTAGSHDWRYDPSGAITPYRHPQTQVMMPHEDTSAIIVEPQELPSSGSTRFEEKIVVEEAPEVVRTEGKDAELKRRKFQRNKQVMKETFDEWEEAYQRDAEQRKTDELFMREALHEAQRAADIWEVPVGAVLVQNGEVIARGCNLVEDLRDSTAHAEIICIREASKKLKTQRLADTTLYVTLEPCAMCADAILQARVDTVVWGAPNKLLGADGSWVRLFPGDGQRSTLDSANRNQASGPVHPFHPKISIRRGVLSNQCSEIMQQFFHLRKKKKQRPESPPHARLPGHNHPVKFFTKMHHMFGTIFCM
ncbi:hypothetical protein ABZP36_011017 [Zizania latifolia]